jgi:hypothetical protein
MEQPSPGTEPGVPSHAGVPGVEGVTASIAFLHASNRSRSSGVRWNTSGEPGVSSSPTAAASVVLQSKAKSYFRRQGGGTPQPWLLAGTAAFDKAEDMQQRLTFCGRAYVGRPCLD